ncbi:uncharacterized protein DNG_04265 [Cephalotrichum gorgonifer]|uniref:Uncharacterized protein n=1 Tax=Cephalotrichum gorgonifer TaxID=2041049 RepID=A0AAE8MWN7_9PEZI|nr:uncharacterized protein DNG_04265 [Cephalotrichum gorgonifer]
MTTSFSSRRRSASVALKKKQKRSGTPFVSDEGPDSYTTPVPPSPHRRVGSATPKRKRKRGALTEEYKRHDNPAIPSTSSSRGRSDPTFQKQHPARASKFPHSSRSGGEFADGYGCSALPELDAPTLDNTSVQIEKGVPTPEAGTFNHPIYLCDLSDDEELVRTQNDRPSRPMHTIVDSPPNQQADKPPCASCLDHLALWEGTSADPVPLCIYGESTEAKCLRCESLSPRHECLPPGRRFMATAKAMVEAAKAIDSDSTYLAFHNAQTRYLRAKEPAAGGIKLENPKLVLPPLQKETD